MKENERFKVANIHICPLNIIDNKYSVNTNGYPERLCVIDEERELAVDIKTCHQYPYVKTMSRLYLLSKLNIEDVKQNKRFACFDYFTFGIDETIKKQANEIKYLLGLGVAFPDGNKELNNEEYLEMLQKEKEGLIISQQKVKKIGKKRK